MKSFLYVLFVLFFTLFVNAQVGIGTITPNGALDITSSTDGLLIPRMALSGTSTVLPVLTATTSELIYNTATVADVTPGFYYLSNSSGPWVRLGGVPGWFTTGNTGIVDGVDFIGTAAATNIDVAFRRNNVAAGKIGVSSTSFGVGALTNGAATNSTAIGNNALSVNTGSNNVAVGQSALQNSNSAQWNTAVGNNSLSGINNSAAQNNTAVGYNAMANGTGNISNVVAIGANALLQNRANNTTAIGFNALQGQVAGGTGNTGVGYSVLNNNTTGDNNTALGNEAGFDTTGSNNTYVGYFAGRFPGSSSNNTFIGFQAGQASTGSNNIAIGNGAQIAGALSNRVQIGNSSISNANIQVAWTITSDRKWKENIKNSSLGLDFIKTLRPVSYVRKNDLNKKTEYGFIAQELEEGLLQAGDANNGIISKDESGMFGVRYNDFISITVKAVQEQQLLIEELQKANAALTKTNTAILKRLEALENNTLE